MITLTCRLALCAACGIFAAVQRIAAESDRYAVTGWCAICRANSRYAHVGNEPAAAPVGHLDRALTGAR